MIEECSERMVAALGPAHFAFQRNHEFAVIGQPRQRIVGRLVTVLIFAILSVMSMPAAIQPAISLDASRSGRSVL
jgi:hypothetical protein